MRYSFYIICYIVMGCLAAFHLNDYITSNNKSKYKLAEAFIWIGTWLYSILMTVVYYMTDKML